jgi:histidinol dehydrogenase
MPVERLACNVRSAEPAAARLRSLVPAPESVSGAVAEIVETVKRGYMGDEGLLAVERRFGGGDLPVRASEEELRAALDGLDAQVREGLETAVANVRRVAEAGLAEDTAVVFAEGHSVTLREVPVRRAAVYAPGGRAPYPSSVVMGAVTARAAGVEQLVVAAAQHPVILAAAALCGADEVYRMSGAQAIAALAHGTESVRPVDVVVGPGNLYVQEAKRQVSDRVGIDGFAGPSDLVVVASDDADIELVALDLRAQAEHGEGTLVVAIHTDEAWLDAVAAKLSDHSLPGEDGVTGREASGLAGGAVAACVEVEDLEAALALAEALAPEHLQLVGAAAEALAPRVTRAGCLFVGAESGTAFGDYVAGSNHVLPTGGAARFASALSVRHFRRRMSEVRIGGAAAELARAAAPVARAEGFEVHARSMEARAMRQNGRP